MTLHLRQPFTNCIFIVLWLYAWNCLDIVENKCIQSHISSARQIPGETPEVNGLIQEMKSIVSS